MSSAVTGATHGQRWLRGRGALGGPRRGERGPRGQALRLSWFRAQPSSPSPTSKPRLRERRGGGADRGSRRAGDVPGVTGSNGLRPLQTPCPWVARQTCDSVFSPEKWGSRSAPPSHGPSGLEPSQQHGVNHAGPGGEARAARAPFPTPARVTSRHLHSSPTKHQTLRVHFTNEETEARKGYATCSNSRSY